MKEWLLIFTALLLTALVTAELSARFTAAEMRANLDNHRLEVDCGPP